MADDSSYLDELNRREISISRYATNLLKEYTTPNLEAAYKSARSILLDAEEITSITKLNKVTAEVIQAIKPPTDEMYAELTAELDDFGFAEAKYSAGLLEEFSAVAIAVPAADKLASYVSKSPMNLTSGATSKTRTWGQLVKVSVDSIVSTISNEVEIGEDVRQIVKRVKTVQEGVLKKQAEALVRTGVQHYAVRSREYMYEDNADVLEGGRAYPITTWDSRRTLICTSIEAKYGKKGWPTGKSPVGLPPFHFGCRTIIVRLPKGAKLEDTRPAIKGRKGAEAEEAYNRKTASTKKYTGRKDKAFEAQEISVNTPLSKFLRDQPEFYQNQLLGKERADLFRAGELDLSKLTDKHLKPLSIKQIRDGK